MPLVFVVLKRKDFGLNKMGRFTLLDYLLDLSLNHIDNHFTNVNASNHGNPLQIKRKSEDLDTSKILLFFCKR